jgi:uncharacterized NAD(P)/FAD-binding protein YdhS
VGCGAAGVAALIGLLESLESSPYKKISITIFEKNVSFGSGMPYQCDSEELLMNMVSSTTSIFPHQEIDFWKWMLDRGHSIGGEQIFSGSGVSPDGYISRQFFGLYLRSRLEDVITSLESLGVCVCLINLEVEQIRPIGEKFEVMTAQKDWKIFDYVILCVGNNPPKDIFNLSGHSQYINNPYPISRYLRFIDPKDNVGIIGAQLTAADIAIALANQGHQGEITLLSRDRNFPLIRCQVKQYVLTSLTFKNLRSLRERNPDGISIRQILRLARKDFANTGVKWNKFFINPSIEYCDWIKGLLDGHKAYSSWLNFAIATDVLIGYCWDSISPSEKKLFMDKFHRLWMSKRVPLPFHTALKLYSLFQAGILFHQSQLKGIRAISRNKFIAYMEPPKNTRKASKIYFDWLINATGPSIDIEAKDCSLLISNLLSTGLAVKNPLGGIVVDFETSLIKNRDSQKTNNFYAIGSLTTGSYYFMSSLDMVSIKASKVAKHLVESMDRNLSNQGLPRVFLGRKEYDQQI